MWAHSYTLKDGDPYEVFSSFIPMNEVSPFHDRGNNIPTGSLITSEEHGGGGDVMITLRERYTDSTLRSLFQVT